MSTSPTRIIPATPYDRLVIDSFPEETVSVYLSDVLLSLHLSMVRHDHGHVAQIARFEPEQPVRFQVEVLLPMECRNACVTLNGQRLIGWFSDAIPDPDVFVLPPACGHGKDVSTLCPGEVQALNFRWMTGDELVFHLFY